MAREGPASVAPEGARGLRIGRKRIKPHIAQGMGIQPRQCLSGAVARLPFQHADRGGNQQPRQRGQGSGAQSERFGGRHFQDPCIDTIQQLAVW